MSLRGITLVIVIAVAALAYVAWNRNTEKPAASASQSAPSAAEPAPPGSGEPGAMGSSDGTTPMVQTATDPGLTWDVPTRWTDQGPGTMRLATYAIPGKGGADEAQCAVYYFGPGQGGDVEANLSRWRGEFKAANHEKRRAIQAKDARVTRVALRGTYMAHASMMGGGEPVESPNWALLGAIAEGPKGSVFFKLTGPVATDESAEKEFDSMLEGICKQ